MGFHNNSNDIEHEFDVNEVLRVSSKICEACTTKDCCTKEEEAFLTEQDIEKIKENSRLEESEFVNREQYEGKIYQSLKLKKNGTCIFFSDETRKCTIYEFRPADCQLFPLDIDKRSGVFKWIQYTICDLSWILSRERLKAAENTILPILREDIEEFADEDMKLYDEGKFIVYKKIEFQDTG